jgi:PTH1 family peptidyl-tRNA hydrolase
MLLLVGLGNPGPRYAKNRHNVGFMAVDRIVRDHSFGAFRARARFEGEIAEGILGPEKAVALKPDTFMNESGRSVRKLSTYYKIAPERIIVVHDDLDLAPGKVKVKLDGGNAGHNGLEDIDAHIGRDYWRLRIGIGHPGDRDLVTPYVLSDFVQSDSAWLDPLLDAIAEAAPLLSAGDELGFMSRVARLARREEAAAAKTDPGPPDGS